MISVKGKRAFITDASRDIGYLPAKFMSDMGCSIGMF